ncbi:MAG: tetratricopeptide repeat protein [Lewinella sp.]|nr:tetratricopeptide repeat protein [Lewinella sp.]
MMRTILVWSLGLLLSVPGWAQEQVSEDVVNREKVFIEANREKLLGNYDEAIALLRDLHRQLPNEAAIAFELGRLHHATEDITEAVRYLKMACEQDPTNDWYPKYLADIYQAEGRNEEGARLYETLVERHPDDPYLYFKWAFFLVRAQKIDDALEVYDALEDRMGINEEIVRRRHTLYLGQGDTRRAARELERLIEAFPEVVSYRHLLASFYESQNNTEAARKVYEGILEVAPHDARAELALAGGSNQQRDEIAFLRQLRPVFERVDVDIDLKISQLFPFVTKVAETGDREIADAALELTEVLEQVHGSNAKGFAVAGDLYYHSGRRELALEKYEATLAIDKTEFEVWAQVLHILYELENFDHLADRANDAMDIFPNQAMVQYFYALGADGLDRYDDALDALSLADMMAGRDPRLRAEIRALTGQVHQHAGNMTAAQSSFDQAREQGADAPEVMFRYSQFLLEKEDTNDAREQAQRAYQTNPSNPHYAYGLSRALYAAGAYERATEPMNRALENGADHWPRALELQGDIRFRLNDVAGAVEWWQKALETGGDRAALEQKIAERRIVE